MTNTTIDGHAHVFPYLGGVCGWNTTLEHMAWMQKSLYRPARLQAAVKTIASSESQDINFRVGKFGRFEWTEGGVDYYLQFMPPCLQDQTAPPEFILAQMDHAGVDIAILQNTKIYGKLNDFFVKCVKMYPDRFIGLAEIDELQADNSREISKLRYAIRDLGLRGIYYEATRFLKIGNAGGFNDKKFDQFWQEVSDLGIPVHWSLVSARMPAEVYIEQMRLFSSWAVRFDNIASVVVHGLFARPFREDGVVRFPKELLDIFKKANVFAEILYPIQVGPFGWDYPFPEARELIKQQYEEFGAHKLIWGSDIPNVERNCTYRQSLTYLTNYCDFIPRRDMDLILGGNIARIMRIQPRRLGVFGPTLADIA